MRLNPLVLFLAVWNCLVLAGCLHTAPPKQSPTLAPPLPTPSPINPGQPVVPGSQPPPPTQAAPASPPPGQSNIPLPPGTSAPPPGVTAPPPGVSPPGVTLVPASPEQGRVQGMAARLYQANPWLKMRPQWIVRPGDVPGLANQGDQYALISEGLVRSANDGQLAAVMSLHLADMAAGRQKMIADTERAQRLSQPRPPYFPGSNTLSSELAYLNQAEAAKWENDPRDPRRHEQREQPINPPNFARQVLTQAGYPAQELESAAPLLQRFPPVRSAK